MYWPLVLVLVVVVVAVAATNLRLAPIVHISFMLGFQDDKKVFWPWKDTGEADSVILQGRAARQIKEGYILAGIVSLFGIIA